MLFLEKLCQQRVTRDFLNCLYLGERLWQMLTGARMTLEAFWMDSALPESQYVKAQDLNTS